MKKIVSFIIILYSQLFAQSELGFEFDYARFKYDSSSVYMEFYYELNTTNMKVRETDAGQVKEAIVHIEMKNLEADTFFINKDWKITHQINEQSDNQDRNYTGVIGFIISKGNYSLLIKAYDVANPSFNKVINEKIIVNPFKDNKYSISDIQIATNIKKDGADPNSIFYKNTLEVIPNPSMTYTDKMPMLFYYAELYNLLLEDADNEFKLFKVLYNSIGEKVFEQSKKIKQSQNSFVEIGTINLSKLPTDSYNLVFSLVDNKTNQAYISTKRFYYYNAKYIDTSKAKIVDKGVLGSEFAILDKNECDKMFSQIKYIATQQEIDQYKKLDSLAAKREFLYNFWKQRDPDPSTSINEFKEDYMKRVEYANRNFSIYSKEGYLTDRGRVYLIYGEPDQRDYYPSEANMKPYEVWFYNQIEGGVSFIFGDVTGFGNYELLHSTKRGEVRDDNWQRRLSTQ
ncbi:GWxTD domain-containing protein [Rosettibacter firmus]|uniref:GWxTD domain-containing protein n=1 Tax=Rosettibacter firmus TaxID=3111522 RepID=UPI00336BB95C